MRRRKQKAKATVSEAVAAVTGAPTPAAPKDDNLYQLLEKMTEAMVRHHRLMGELLDKIYDLHGYGDVDFQPRAYE